jgi:hypothetical protein
MDILISDLNFYNRKFIGVRFNYISMKYPPNFYMPTVHLKTGEVVEVSLEELENYLRVNQDKILVRHLKRRGLIRGKNAPVISPLPSSR